MLHFVILWPFCNANFKHQMGTLILDYAVCVIMLLCYCALLVFIKFKV